MSDFILFLDTTANASLFIALLRERVTIVLFVKQRVSFFSNNDGRTTMRVKRNNIMVILIAVLMIFTAIHA